MTETLVEDSEETAELEAVQNQLKKLTRKALFDRSEAMRKDIDKLTRDVAAIKEKRENYNREARGWRTKRDASMGMSPGDLEDLRNRADENKRLRDETNTQIQLLKKEREHLTEKIRQEWAAVRQAKTDFRELQSEIGPVPAKINEEIERLEWKQQTTPNLSIEEENALIEYITDLYGKVVAASTLDKAYERMQGSMNRARETITEREKIHEKVVELAEESQKYHETMIQVYQQMDELRQKGMEFHEQYRMARKNADAVHQEVVSLQERIRKARQKLKLVTGEMDLRRRRKIVERTSQDREVAEKKLSAGNRVTLDELRLLLESQPQK